MEENQPKTCRICEEQKYTEDFYPRRNVCKECDKQRRKERYAKKGSGFQLLPEEKKRSILAKIEQGVVIKRIAKDEEIPYANLLYWRRSGQIRPENI